LHYNILVAGNTGVGKSSFIVDFLGLNLEPNPTRTIVHNRARRLEFEDYYLIDMIDTPGYSSLKSFEAWLNLLKAFI
jgi:predicted GTPase